MDRWKVGSSQQLRRRAPAAFFTLYLTDVAMARIPFLLTFWEASDMPSSILPPYAGEEKKHLDGEGLEPR